MKRSTTLVLDDRETLHQVCGPNDENLHYLETLFAAPVVVRGNEVGIQSDDDSVKQRFVHVLQEMEEHVRNGHAPNRDVIRAILAEVEQGEAGRVDMLRREVLEIPGGFGNVFPRSITQARLVHSFDTKDLTLCVGPAGTGKTYLAVAHALREVLNRRKRKLILTRPVVEAGENLGYLPGDLAQKISPYLRPLYDAIESLVPHELVQKLKETETIEVAPLAYMRGRSLRDAYVILDEAQNTTRTQMKMFLTRLGENSKAVVTGDITQIDLPHQSASGLTHALRVLHQIREIGVVHLKQEDIVRSALVRRIIKAYDEFHE